MRLIREKFARNVVANSQAYIIIGLALTFTQDVSMAKNVTRTLFLEWKREGTSDQTKRRLCR